VFDDAASMAEDVGDAVGDAANRVGDAMTKSR